MVLNKFTLAWYVLHTRSRFENVVYDGLVKKSLEVFLPKIQMPSRRKDRSVMLKVPLFPGYLFVKSNLKPREHIEIVKTTGAVNLIGSKAGPVPVPDETIASLQIMVRADQYIRTGRRFRKGDRVMVVNGPFMGVRGAFARYGGKGRVVVHIDALSQYAAVEVDEKDLEFEDKIF